MEYVVSIVNKSVKKLLICLSASHMSSNVILPSEYPSFRHLRRNELSLTLSTEVAKEPGTNLIRRGFRAILH